MVDCSVRVIWFDFTNQQLIDLNSFWNFRNHPWGHQWLELAPSDKLALLEVVVEERLSNNKVIYDGIAIASSSWMSQEVSVSQMFMISFLFTVYVSGCK